LGGKQGGGGGRGLDTYRETGGGGVNADLPCSIASSCRLVREEGEAWSAARRQKCTTRVNSLQDGGLRSQIVRLFILSRSPLKSRRQEVKRTHQRVSVCMCERREGEGYPRTMSPETPHPKGEHGVCVCVCGGGGGGGRYPCSICNAHYPCSIAASSRLVLVEGAQHQTMVRVAGSIESVRICATVCARHTQLQAPLRLRPGWS
jgi:hypothetical protein